MFAYCGNNPVMGYDPTGHFWEEIGNSFKNVGKAIGSFISSFTNDYTSVSYSNSANTRSLPKTGEPGSSQTLPNPDGTPKQKRWYGPDGNAERDRDYNHGGNMPFPHDHEWKDGKRQPDHLPPDPSYEFSLEPVLGVGLVIVCGVGIALVAADDAIGIGVADDFLFGPLGAGASKGFVMIFG